MRVLRGKLKKTMVPVLRRLAAVIGKSLLKRSGHKPPSSLFTFQVLCMRGENNEAFLPREQSKNELL